MSTTGTPNTEVRERRLDASTYDRWFDIPWGRYAFNVEVGIVLEAMGSLADGVRVLDAGCGTGRFTARLEASGASVVGLDLDPAMLDVASARTRARVSSSAMSTAFPCGTGPSTESLL